MRHRSVQSRAGVLTAAAVMAVGLGVSAAQASFVLDLKLTAGGTATTVLPGTDVSIDVFGTVTGSGPAAEGLQDAFFGVQNSGTIGDIKALPSGQGVALASPFNGVATDVTPGVTTSYGGTIYGTAGSKAVGSTNSNVADGWVFARSTSMTTVTDGVATKLGTLTFSVSPSATAGASATLSINARQAVSSLVVPAVWQEDGVEKDGAATVGSSVVITVKSASLPGDVNNDGSVDGLDINPFVFALVNGQAAFQTQYPTGSFTNADVNGDNSVDGLDINPFVAILVGSGEPGINAAALAAVPEPASLGLLSMGALALVRRRRR